MADKNRKENQRTMLVLQCDTRDNGSSVFCNFACPKIASFWNALRARVTDFNPNYFLSCETILFGVVEPVSQATSAFNFLILLGKQFILRCKYQETLPSFKQFNYHILAYKVTEEVIAKKKNNLNKHNVKWQNINKHFSIA